MYYSQHWVIDWGKVKSLDDIKLILETIQITFEPTHDTRRIQYLLKFEDKPTVKLTPT